MSMENDIVNILKKHPKGLRRNAIAKYTGFNNSAIKIKSLYLNKN